MHHEPRIFLHNFIIPNIHILTSMRVISNLSVYYSPENKLLLKAKWRAIVCVEGNNKLVINPINLLLSEYLVNMCFIIPKPIRTEAARHACLFLSSAGFGIQV